MLNKITTGKPVSTHKHTDNARWSLCRKHSGFPQSRGSLPKPVENDERDRGEELGPGPTTLRPRQNAIPTQSLFLSFYSPRREGRYISLHHFYSLSFRIEIRLDFLSNECVLPRIFTSADLYLTIYNTTKLVPTCKGRFTHIDYGFRLGTVFSTTSAPT